MPPFPLLWSIHLFSLPRPAGQCGSPLGPALVAPTTQSPFRSFVHGRKTDAQKAGCPGSPRPGAGTPSIAAGCLTGPLAWLPTSMVSALQLSKSFSINCCTAAGLLDPSTERSSSSDMKQNLGKA